MSIVSAWFGKSRAAQTQQMRRATNVGKVDRYPSHHLAVLPDGQLMEVRVASLAAAKDLLAAQHAVERRQRAEREAWLLRAAGEIVAEADAAPQSR